ncbi:GerMN domain-containing protein [Geodermatophilus sp. SYSU D01036]
MRRAAAPPVLAALLVVAGCGVPTGQAPATIAPSDVPYGLASPSTPSPPAPTTTPRTDQPRILLVGPGDVLVPRGREVTGSVPDQLAALLAQLADGPTAEERRQGLSTALPPGVTLSAAEVEDEDEVEDGTVTVDLGGTAEAPSGRESRTAVAQIVLTATSVPGIAAVRLTSDGVPVEAPLPSGELTSTPLTAADYAGFLTAPPD